MTGRYGAPPRRRLPRIGRRPQPGILVLCGAHRTEPDYFNALKRHLRSTAVTVRALGGLSPAKLVKHGNSVLASGDFDAVWCVFDKDEFDIVTAASEAARRGVEVAISNPCFELWLLLHHTDHSAYATCAQVAARLVGVVSTYNKSRLDFRHFSSGVGTAIERARQLEHGADSLFPNPSAGVWRLAELMTNRSA